MVAYYSFYVKSIVVCAPAFLGYIISVLASVQSQIIQSLTNQNSLYFISNGPIETKMGQAFSMLSLPYLTFVCYPVAKSNNPTQGFSVMQVLTLLQANLDYT
jgi:hypothetical protein